MHLGNRPYWPEWTLQGWGSILGHWCGQVLRGLKSLAGSRKTHGPPSTSWARTFIYLFFAMLDKFFLSLYYMPGTVLVLHTQG